ncbi:hypothetical protein ACFL6K_04600 [Candidatus Latescibacterota bacterium]
MKNDYKLVLREKFLSTDAIIFEAEGYDAAEIDVFDEYIREQDVSDLMISVHRDTGEVLQIIVEAFVSGTELAIKMLQKYPLPWTFSVPSMNIEKKPLEDILKVIHKKYKNIKMSWD